MGQTSEKSPEGTQDGWGDLLTAWTLLSLSQLSMGKCFKPEHTKESCQEFVTEGENLKDGKQTLLQPFPLS